MSYKKEGKENFRLTEVITKVWKHLSSYTKSSLAAAILCVTSFAVFAESNLTKVAIDKSVSQEFSQQLELLAERRGWKNYSSNLDIRIPKVAEHLPLCPNPLVISGLDNKILPVGNLRRTVSCHSDSVNWKINLTVKSSLTLDTVVAKAVINRGESVTSGHIALEKRTLTWDQDLFTTLADVPDKIALRRIRTGQVIDPGKLKNPALIKKGNQVVIVASKDGFTASTKGVALVDGEKGEQIDVRNTSSGKIIKAVVSGLNRVETQF